MHTVEAPKVIVSAAIEAEDRAELERMATEGDRTLSQEIRRALRDYLARRHNEEGAA
jgi:predicted transcriptional regulator